MATRACGRVRGEGVACIAAGMNCVAAIAALLTEMSCRGPAPRLRARPLINAGSQLSTACLVCQRGRVSL